MTDERHLIGRRPVHQGNYKWAIYRMHYGLDFLSQSISSIRDDVDKIFICYSLQPWVVRDKVSYLGDEIDMPNNPENIEEYLKIYNDDPKVHCFRAEFNTPKNQFRQIYDMCCEMENTTPNKVLFMEPDMVYQKGDLSKMFDQFKKSTNDDTMIPAMTTYQIELWKTFKWRVPQRERTGPVIWNIDVSPEFKTHLGPEPDGGSLVIYNDMKNYNFGFCFNSLTMYYKHLTAIQFSSTNADSIPSQEWYRDKWTNWTPDTENLEIAENYKYLIKRAESFEMPEQMSDQMHGQI